MYASMLMKMVLTLITTVVLLAADVLPGQAQILFNNNPDGSYGSGSLGASANNSYNVGTMAGDVFNGGVPTNPIATSTLSNVTWTSSATYGDYNVSGTIQTPFTLEANLTYYLGLSGNTGSSDISFSFLSTETLGPADVAYVMNNGVLQPAPTEVSPSLAFSIDGTASVPEPSSSQLIWIGLGALALAIRRRLRVS